MGAVAGSLEDQAHLWLTRPAALPPGEDVDRALALLDDEERRRAAGYLRPEQRTLAIVAHALVRRTLSRYAPVAPAAWRFSPGPQGRPEISAPPDTGLRFNLSHTSGLAACVVTYRTPCGVDVERVVRATQRVALADRLLSEPEAAALAALPPAARGRGFYARWTLKEAYLKARGLGLGVELDTVQFDLDGDGGVRLRLAPELDDSERAWQLWCFEPTAEHVLAVALRIAGRGPLPIVVREVPALGRP